MRVKERLFNFRRGHAMLGDVIDIQDLEVNAVDSVLTINLNYIVRLTNQQQTATLTRKI